MAKQAKCKYCKKVIKDYSNATKKSNAWYHNSCLKEQEFKNAEKKKYTDYIQAIYIENGYNKEEINWVLLMSQTSNILSEHPKWTYHELLFVLKYLYEVERKNLFAEQSRGSILSLISSNFTTARNFYMKKEAVRKSTDGVDFDDTIIYLKRKNTDYDKSGKTGIDMKTLLDDLL